ncbi:MAG: S8 family serine peptidase [Methylococcales bacterium]
MANQPQDKRPHLILTKTSKPKDFTAHNTGGGSKTVIPELPRNQHGTSLLAQLELIKPIAQQTRGLQQELGLESGLGLQIQFQSQPDVELAFESIGNDTKHIELLSIRKDGDNTIANVFVPDGKLEHFEKLITDYLAEKKDKNGKPNDNKKLLNTINAIRTAELRALWTDDINVLPQNHEELFWWEVWLTNRGDRETVVEDFNKLANAAGCTVSDARVDFPERTVVLMYGSEQQLSQSVMTLNCVAELRRAKETAEFFDGMNNEEQQEWQANLLERTTFPNQDDNTARVCLIDSGVNRGHVLLAPVIASADLFTVEPAWGTNDESNHGTGLAGVTAYGDLTEALSTNEPIQIDFLLESVKIIKNEGDNHGDSKFHAKLFGDAVSQPEVVAPNRPRVFSSAVTASDFRDRGRPSSWSAMVDRLASDADGAGQFRRLIILSAGNIKGKNAWDGYPDSLSTNLIHDPGQAWNAITVGAFTEKTETHEPTLQAVANSGELSPFSTTSASWDKVWPLKPDVVFEGGNLGKNIHDGFIGTLPSLNLLTTHYKPTEKLFTTTNATSAASALCARMAAKLMMAYPHISPETIRALIVHSAAWTENMRHKYLPANKPPTKNDYVNLIRHCGWGVPDIEVAKWSASNSLTLIVEDAIHPYKKEKGESVKTRDMNLHSLPWPKEELEALGATTVQMRVTLSYFIEPNPSARGTASKFHYPSCRLRFDVRRALESTEDFLARISAAIILVEDEQQISTKDPDWKLGDQNRHKGSLHQDIWEGTAADLASRGFLAIYPAMGWWRTRPKLERFKLPVRYSLIVSIRTPETDVDIYNAVAQQLEIAAPIVIET